MQEQGRGRKTIIICLLSFHLILISILGGVLYTERTIIMQYSSMSTVA